MSEKSRVAPLACVSAEEANHMFLMLYFPPCSAALAEWRRDEREGSLEAKFDSL